MKAPKKSAKSTHAAAPKARSEPKPKPKRHRKVPAAKLAKKKTASPMSAAKGKSRGGTGKRISRSTGSRRPLRLWESYDRAKWHYQGDFPSGLSPENGGTHIGIYLAWAVNHAMASRELIADAGRYLDEVRKREITGRELLFRHLDGSLTADDLNTEGNAFARHYYKSYTGDYDRLVRTRFPTPYHGPDDWEHYEWVAAMIEKRYRKWRAGRARSSRR